MTATPSPARSARAVARLSALAALLSAGAANATIYCVSTPTDLRAALTASDGNGQSDEIRIRQGDYIPNFQSTIAFGASLVNDESLDLSGGWTGAGSACTTQSLTVGSTRLVASVNDTVQLLHVTLANGATGELSISNLNFTAGKSAERGGCLQVYSANGSNTATVVIDRNEFFACRAMHGGAAEIDSSLGAVRFRGNDVFANTTLNGSGAVLIFTGGGDAFVSNNTFRGNLIQVGSISGLRAYGGVSWVTNNVFKSATTDLIVDNQTALIRNLYGTLSGTPDVSQSNIVGDPLFVNGNLGPQLSAQSPARNTGTNSPFGGALSVDIDGNTRPQEGTMDRGASELVGLFGNGFESF